MLLAVVLPMVAMGAGAIVAAVTGRAAARPAPAVSEPSSVPVVDPAWSFLDDGSREWAADLGRAWDSARAEIARDALADAPPGWLDWCQVISGTLQGLRTTWRYDPDRGVCTVGGLELPEMVLRGMCRAGADPIAAAYMLAAASIDPRFAPRVRRGS